MEPKFKPGDRVRRISHLGNFNGVQLGGEYIIAACRPSGNHRSNQYRLAGHAGLWVEDRFELIPEVTPGDVCDAIEGFVEFILRDPPMGVGDIYDYVGIRRTILAIHGEYVWLSNPAAGMPGTGLKSAVEKNYTRVFIAPRR